ncbi:CAF17-like 4Fe-4S cluster assembly/insertion protein YgfZ [Sphingomonas sp. Ag1]|jgi:folate-binding protein YgfZ|uniref:CAF17-like 4Fe-4S cluster assembly/insertion protein YgfZ n=1 Tax=Sphingomonas sp. Ag1 TaxID=1642949 RepID=UPI0006221196|nr:folate-binding protein YgfZ [Sphingomonas sp. Ag1]KKI18501.1 aminomethyltransferase [Sphingomonas sp. Ag1]
MTNATMLTDRAVLRLSGEDVRGFLQGLVTNDVTGPLPVWTALLTPQGKALFDFLVWADGEDLLLDCGGEQADALAKRLTLYRLRRKIAIARDDSLAVHWAVDGSEGVPDPRLATLGQRWIAAPGAAAEGWLAHRLSLGVTEGVGELGSGETLWLECNARELNGVSFGKGCYVGQENTARMNYRSKVNRRLVVAPLTEAGDRTRATYPALGLMVEHRRVESLGDAIIPPWLADALATAPAD